MLCYSVDGSPPGSSGPGTLQAGALEWALPFAAPGHLPTQGSSQCLLQCVWTLCHLSPRGSPLDHEGFIYCDIVSVGEHMEYTGVALGRSVNLVMEANSLGRKEAA